MAKQDEEIKATVPPAAVGQVTVETKEPDGDVTVQTVPAAQVKAEATPRPRPTRDARQRARQAAQAERQARQKDAPTPRPQLAATQAQATEERSITLALTPRQWARLDAAVARSNQKMGDYLRRMLAPLLR